MDPIVLGEGDESVCCLAFCKVQGDVAMDLGALPLDLFECLGSVAVAEYFEEASSRY